MDKPNRVRQAFKATHRAPGDQKVPDTASDATLRTRVETLRADRADHA